MKTNRFMTFLCLFSCLAVTIGCGSAMAKLSGGAVLDIKGEAFFGDGFFEITFNDESIKKNCGMAQMIESFTKPTILNPGQYDVSVSIIDYPAQNIPGKPKYDMSGPFTRHNTKNIGKVNLSQESYKVVVGIHDSTEKSAVDKYSMGMLKGSFQVNNESLSNSQKEKDYSNVSYSVKITDSEDNIIFDSNSN